MFITETMTANYYAALGARNGEGYSDDAMEREWEEFGCLDHHTEDARMVDASDVADADWGVSFIVAPGWVRLIPGQYATPWEA